MCIHQTHLKINSRSLYNLSFSPLYLYLKQLKDIMVKEAWETYRKYTKTKLKSEILLSLIHSAETLAQQIIVDDFSVQSFVVNSSMIQSVC